MQTLLRNLCAGCPSRRPPGSIPGSESLCKCNTHSCGARKTLTSCGGQECVSRATANKPTPRIAVRACPTLREVGLVPHARDTQSCPGKNHPVLSGARACVDRAVFSRNRGKKNNDNSGTNLREICNTGRELRAVLELRRPQLAAILQVFDHRRAPRLVDVHKRYRPRALPDGGGIGRPPPPRDLQARNGSAK